MSKYEVPGARLFLACLFAFLCLMAFGCADESARIMNTRAHVAAVCKEELQILRGHEASQDALLASCDAKLDSLGLLLERVETKRALARINEAAN